MRKGLDDFIIVFIIAIVLLAAIGIAGVLLPQMPGGSGGEEFNLIEEFNIGAVGFLTSMPAKTTSLGTLAVGEKQTELLRTIPRLDLGTSIFGGNKEAFEFNIPSHFVETQDGVTLDFIVADTNQYGNLIIEWNGAIVFNDRPRKGAVTVEIGKEKVKESNSLFIYAQGPGALFWASSVYLIRDFKVNLNYGPARLFSFELLQSELESFDKGEISFFGVGADTLSIKINGVEVFGRSPAGSNTLIFNFSQIPLKAGDNIISFSTPSKVDLHESVIKIYLFGNQMVRTRTFDINANELAAIQSRGGIIEFDVDSVNRNGVLMVEINDIVLKQFGDLTTGTYTLAFTADDVQEGDNIIKFSGTGSFDITSARIGWI